MKNMENLERKPQEITYTVEVIRGMDNKKIEDLARNIIQDDYWLDSDAENLFELKLCNIYIQAQNISTKYTKKRNIFAIC